MRLVTWNCCAGPLNRKLSALTRLAADIAIVPECPQVPESLDKVIWIGTSPRKGLAVFAASPWCITLAQAAEDLPRFFLPIQVTGPESFLLIAVWAQNDGADRYVRGAHRAVVACESIIRSQPTVILGDFNSNTIWDKEHPKDRNHSALVDKLALMGLSSAYHTHYAENHGTEARATFYEYRHAHRPYHIDYCFIPTTWGARIDNVVVGDPTDWLQWSDHMPLSIDIVPLQGLSNMGSLS